MHHHRVKPKPFFFSCLIVVLFSSTNSYAQEDQLKFDRFTTENGLSSNVVYCILQDKNGFLWVGTNDGLNRYDGYNFKTYRSDPGDSSSLASNSVYALCEDKNGNLWIGTPAGICKYNSEKNNFTKVPLFNNLGATQILLVNKDELVINSGEGYLTLNLHSLKSIPLQKSERFKSHYYNNLVTKDSKNNAYITLTREDTTVIIKSGPAGQPFTEFLTVQGHGKILKNSRIYFVDSRNNSWIGTAMEGNLFHYSPTKGNKFVPEKCLVKKGIGAINQIFEDKDGKIWIAAAKGLFKYDYNTDAWSEIMYNSSPGSSNTTLTMSIFQDRNGLIWIGGYNGLFKLNPTIGKFSHFRSGQHQTSLKDNFILGIYPGKENKVWINYHWGVRYFSLLDFAKQSVQHYRLNDPIFKTLIREAYVQNSRYIDEDSIQSWMNHFHPQDRALPFFLVFDRQKKLWINSGNTLKKMGEEYSLKFTTPLMDEKISGDDIWVATDGEGLQSFNTISRTASKYVYTDGSNSISNNHLTCLLTEKNGNLWIGTRGNGLDYFDREKNIFLHYTTEHGLSNNSVYSLVKDHKDRLWVGTANGLSCLDISSGKFKSFYRSDGLINSEYNRYSACRLPNGYLLMGGMDGIDYFHPDSVLTTPVKSQVQITGFKVLNKSVLQSSPIRLKHNQNYVTIDFATMDFRNPTLNKYEYKMEGIDKDWVTSGSQHSVSYASLDPGRYSFVVRSVNSDGSRTDKPAEISFSIITPWWSTAWFLSLAAICMLSGIYSIYRFRIRQLKKLIAVRTRISQDLHDEVGATLTSISFLSEVVKKQTGNGQSPAHETIEKIGEFSRNMIGEMNDIVWAINPTNDKFEKIENRMQNFASTFLAEKKIGFNFKSDGQIRNISLGMQQRKNLYLIFKEAVNNSAKYAGCKEVNVAIYRENNHIQMEITDDGKGFTFGQENGNGGGNGLKNMKERAAEINAGFSINSAPGRGTNIIVTVPITQNAY